MGGRTSDFAISGGNPIRESRTHQDVVWALFYDANRESGDMIPGYSNDEGYFVLLGPGGGWIFYVEDEAWGLEENIENVEYYSLSMDYLIGEFATIKAAAKAARKATEIDA